MLNKTGMQAFVFDLLDNNLSDWYHYHDAAHTLYVMDKVVEIGQASSCSPEEIDLLRVAALWHDTGHIIRYMGHEKESCVLVQEHLPGYGFTVTEIVKICGMIMATKMPQTPLNRLEQVIADADLEYLGTDEVDQKSQLLFLELQHLDPSMTKTDWGRLEVAFLQEHHYFTQFCIDNRQPKKQLYLERMIKNMDDQFIINLPA